MLTCTLVERVPAEPAFPCCGKLLRYSQYEEQASQRRQRESPTRDSPIPVGTPMISAKCLRRGLSVVVAVKVVTIATLVVNVLVGT